MSKRDKIIAAIYSTIEVVNEMLPSDRRIEKSESSLLMHKDGNLDSMAFIHFIVTLENKIQEQFGVSVNLTEASEKAKDAQPLASVKELVSFLEKSL